MEYFIMRKSISKHNMKIGNYHCFWVMLGTAIERISGK
jgi:hypothetical protein